MILVESLVNSLKIFDTDTIKIWRFSLLAILPKSIVLEIANNQLLYQEANDLNMEAKYFLWFENINRYIDNCFFLLILKIVRMAKTL